MTSMPKPGSPIPSAPKRNAQTLVMELTFVVPRNLSDMADQVQRDHLIKLIESLTPDLQRSWGIYLESIKTLRKD